MSYLAVEAVQGDSAGWAWKPLRRLSRIRREANTDSSSRLLALSSERGVEYRPDDGGRQLPSDQTIAGYWRVRPGDLVFNPMWAIGGGVAVSELSGAVSTAYRIYELGPELWPRFLHYWLRSETAIAQYQLLIRGITTFDRSITREDLDGMPTPVPPLAVQRAVADYLDRETARIDAVIAAKRRMIGSLEMRLRSVISRTTSVGPEVKVRRVTSLRTSGPRGWGDLVTDDGEVFIRSANLQREDIELRTDNLVSVAPPAAAEAARSRTRPGDVLVGITGANTGWTGLVRTDGASGYVSQHVALLRPRGVNPEWLAYSVFADAAQGQLLADQYGGTKQQLGLDDLADLRIHVPSARDQAAAVAQLQLLKSRTKTLTAAIATQVRLLQKRRQALITAGVTGQLDIPGAT